ncbi:MAG: hypothetical protein QM796_12790 [Chthoniobacteraceae bacterium]
MSLLRKNRIVLGACSLLALPTLTLACGPWLPNRLLDNGGKIILEAPEFYFELEVKQIAQAQPVEFKAVPRGKNADGDVSYAQSNTEADLADFADALAKGAIKPADAAKAKTEHEAARAFINAPPDATSALPEEFASEFADYHRGALAYVRHQPDEARKIWQTLLARPAKERHYRSIWAAYMLGRLELEAKDEVAAQKGFMTVQNLSKDGFADSLGMAAASFGWLARCKLDAHDLEGAAQLYLTQLACGDLTAVSSLDTVAEFAIPIPPTPSSDSDTPTPTPTPTPPPMAFPELAKTPILRKIISAYLLTHETKNSGGDNEGDDSSAPSTSNPLLQSWLQALEKAHLKTVEDADRLAWITYDTSDYKATHRWLKLAAPGSGLALWLSAKLDFRAGSLEKATKELAAAVQQIPRR